MRIQGTVTTTAPGGSAITKDVDTSVYPTATVTHQPGETISL